MSIVGELDAIEVRGGWIYVLGEGSNLTTFQIGFTARNPMDRVRRLRLGNLTIGLLKAYFVPERLASISQAKALLLARFQRIETDDGSISQWCTGTPAQACLDIECYLQDWWQLSHIPGVSCLANDVVCYAWEAELDPLYQKGPRIYPVDGLPM